MRPSKLQCLDFSCSNVWMVQPSKCRLAKWEGDEPSYWIISVDRTILLNISVDSSLSKPLKMILEPKCLSLASDKSPARFLDSLALKMWQTPESFKRPSLFRPCYGSCVWSCLAAIPSLVTESLEGLESPCHARLNMTVYKHHHKLLKLYLTDFKMIYAY